MSYITQPETIEERSFEIIQETITSEYPTHQFTHPIIKAIIKRAIHTTADFDWLDILKFSPLVTEKIQSAFRQGNITLYTDTNMALSGMNKRKLDALNCQYRCFVADSEVAQIAKEKEITRSMAAVDKAINESGKKIFVFGNAPTALFRLLEYSDHYEDIIAVIGVPVGFVGAEESKDALMQSPISYIAAKGRKGGSNVAAAIVNALLYTLEQNN